MHADKYSTRLSYQNELPVGLFCLDNESFCIQSDRDKISQIPPTAHLSLVELERYCLLSQSKDKPLNMSAYYHIPHASLQHWYSPFFYIISEHLLSWQVSHSSRVTVISVCFLYCLIAIVIWQYWIIFVCKLVFSRKTHEALAHTTRLISLLGVHTAPQHGQHRFANSE